VAPSIITFSKAEWRLRGPHCSLKFGTSGEARGSVKWHIVDPVDHHDPETTSIFSN
jgi:hypothetical protein